MPQDPIVFSIVEPDVVGGKRRLVGTQGKLTYEVPLDSTQIEGMHTPFEFERLTMVLARHQIEDFFHIERVFS